MKEEFAFTFNGKFYIKHSEYAIKKLVKEMGIQYVLIERDKGYWSVGQHLTQQRMYTPKY